VRACSFFACISFSCVVTRTSLAPAERRVEGLLRWPCPLDMLESSMFPFVSPPLRPAPLLVCGRRGHPIWSSHVETHSPSPAHLPGVPMEGHRFDPTLNQQSSTKVRACFAVHRTLHARAPLGSSRAPANIRQQSLSPSLIHMLSTRHAHGRLCFPPFYAADLELPLPGAPVPWPHHPFVVGCMRASFLICSLNLDARRLPALSTSELLNQTCVQLSAP
jgi:hypothetical protein